MNNNIDNEIKLDWDKKVFFIEKKKKRKSIIGWNIKATFSSFGKGQHIDDWICMWIKGKNFKLVKSTIQLFKFSSWEEKYFINCSYYFGHLYKMKISGLTYLKMVSCSRLVKKRLKW